MNNNNKLYILCGIPFSGKTTVAKRLVELYGFTRIDLDEVKFKLFGESITDDQIDQTGWDRIYQQMYQQIELSLRNNKTVIHDTGNFTKYERDLVHQIGDNCGVQTITIYIDTPVAIARKRLKENRVSKRRFDITNEAFESAVKEMEPPDSSEPHIIISLKTNLKELRL